MSDPKETIANHSLSAPEKKHRRFWVGVTVGLGAFAAIVEATIINVALPEIKQQFSVSHDQLQLLATAFLASSTVFMLVSQWAVQSFGKRRTFEVTTWILLFFSVAAACMPVGWFIPLALCRTVQGMVAGVIQTLSIAILIGVYPAAERGRAMSSYGLGVVLAPAIGPALGGGLVDIFGWRAVFLLTVPFCAGALILARYWLTDTAMVETKADTQDFDFIGLMLVLSVFCTLLSGLSFIYEHSVVTTVLILLVGVAIAAIFVRREMLRPNPLINFGLLRYPGFVAAILVATIYGVGLYGSTYLALLFAQVIVGMGAFDAGSLLIPGGIVLAGVLMFSGKITDKVHPRLITVIGLACFAGSAMLLTTCTASTTFWWIAAYLVIGRIGLGLIIPGLNVAALKTVPHHLELSAITLIGFFRQLGGAFGVTLLALLVENRERTYKAGGVFGDIGAWLIARHGFAEGFIVLVVGYGVAIVAAKRMRPINNPGAVAAVTS